MSGQRRAVARTVVVLVATLMVGVVLGAALLGTVIRHRVVETRHFVSAEGFSEQMMTLVAPADAAQAAVIRSIVDTHGEEFTARVAANRREFFLGLERLDAALAPHLSAEQKQRLAEHRQALRQQMTRFSEGDEP